MTRRRAWVSIVVALWLICTGWLLFFEAYPGLFTRTAAGYRSLLSEQLLIMDRWMRVSFNGTPIGYSHTEIDTDDRGPMTRYVMENETVLNLAIMGHSRRVRVEGRAALDALYHLQDFTFTVDTTGYELKVEGTRGRGNVFDVVLTSADTVQEFPVTIPDNAILYSPMLETMLQRLEPGKTMKLNVFNPITLSSGEILVRGLRRETIAVDGHDHETVVVSLDAYGMEATAWIAEDGEVLRQRTAFGWEMEVCDPVEALRPTPRGRDAGDLLLAMAVPVTGRLFRPRESIAIDVRLHGNLPETAELQSHRQDVLAATATNVVLRLHRENLPSSGAPIGSFTNAHADALAASPFLQIHDPAIQRRARTLVHEARDSLAAALAINRWVHKSIRREPTVSVPSAVAVLKTLAGDCNEHTTLFTALARAAGIPARILVGLVYNDGAFYYHAWPAVYVGRWVEMDPTLGQDAADATHIKLLEGELADQLKLMGMIGRLRVDVLAETDIP